MTISTETSGGSVERIMPPHFEGPAFECPNCFAYAEQRWRHLLAGVSASMGSGVHMSTCVVCGRFALWTALPGSGGPSMIWPNMSTAPLAHEDMPEAVSALYEEAREVGARSPRAAAALLRLALQVLLLDLVPGEDNINRAIGALVGKGLAPGVQRAMDVVRVIGNNAVHPGQVQVDEDPKLVPSLFTLVNVIVEQVITRQRQVDELFEALPSGALGAIEKRDARRP